MRRAYRDLCAANIIVNTRTGRTFRGVLWSDSRDLLTMRNVALVEGTQETPVDGEVVVERGNIDFVQVVRGAV